MRVDGAYVGGVGVGAIALGSARGCVSDGAQMHASGRGMGLVARVPLGLSCWASEARRVVTAEAGGGAGVCCVESLVEGGVFGRF